jgi:hypothetical protein
MVNRRSPMRYAIAATMALMCGAVAGPAAAQSSTPPLTVDEIRYCMCQEQMITTLRPELEARQAMRAERQQALDLLEDEIDVMQASMDPNDQSQQEQLKAKIYQANKLRDQIRREFGPVYVSTVRDFNAAVQGYNDGCANRRMITVDVAAATDGLSCPPIPQP